MSKTKCIACGGPRSIEFEYCSIECRDRPAPAVYQFICPGMHGVTLGSCADWHTRGSRLFRTNPLLVEALKKNPSKTWTYEVLEKLPPGSSRGHGREAEQKHIVRLRTMDHERGFKCSRRQSREVSR